MKTVFLAFRFLALAALAAGALGLSACSTTANDGTQYLAGGDRPSSLPWNRPESWEGRGALGAMGNDPRIGGTR